MHPTVDEQLRAVRRLLDAVAGDPGLAGPSAQALADASRQLRRLEGSWAARLPFLTDDNRATVELLGEVAPLVADRPGWGEELAAAVAAAEVPTVAEPVAHDRNLALRRLLARAVHELPDSEAGDAARARIAAHLRRRLDADPALHRSPRKGST